MAEQRYRSAKTAPTLAARVAKAALALAPRPLEETLSPLSKRSLPCSARDLAEAAVAMAEQHGFESYAVLGRSVRALVLAESGQSAKGISELKANATWVTGNFQIPVSEMLAQAYLRAVRAELAIGTLDDAVSRAQRMGLHIYDAQLCRLKGEAILMRDFSMIAQAEECFRKGIGIARRQSAKSGELRATTSLARLHAKEGSATRRVRCSPKSTTGSPRASTPPT